MHNESVAGLFPPAPSPPDTVSFAMLLNEHELALSPPLLVQGGAATAGSV